MSILNFINKRLTLQIFCTVYEKKEIEYTTHESLMCQMPFKCDKATFRRHMIALLEAQLIQCTFHETYKVISLNNVIDQELEPEPEPQQQALIPVATVPYKDIQNQWNEFAAQHGLAQIIKLNEQRKSGIRARLTEKEFCLDKILDAVAQNEFFFGNNNSGWKITFDFIFCRTSSYLKILEGFYTKNDPKNVTQLNYKDKAQINFLEGMKAIS
tara:strand:+ start:464 stop:1102 length:639 start_codon:yes stop_codon:yes gene_type:complete